MKDVPLNGSATGTRAADRVADVLLLLAEQPGGWSLSQLATRLDMSKAVVHRILQSLGSRELVVADNRTGHYRLGPATTLLTAARNSDLDLAEVARPFLRDLQDRTDETATVSELVGIHRVYLDQVIGFHQVRMTVPIGIRYPLYAGSSGKVLLAFGDDDLRRQVFDKGWPALTPHTPDRRQLEDELLEIRKHGVATSRGERQEGAAGVAAVVLDADRRPIGAIGLCGPTDRFGPAQVRHYATLVRESARQVTGAVRAGSGA